MESKLLQQIGEMRSELAQLAEQNASMQAGAVIAKSQELDVLIAAYLQKRASAETA